MIVGQQILQSLGIRSFTPQVTACPGCGRTTSTFFQEMAEQIQTYLATDAGMEEQVSGVEEMKVAVMGCVVTVRANPSMQISAYRCPAPSKSPRRRFMLTDGLMTTLKGDRIVAEFFES